MKNQKKVLLLLDDDPTTLKIIQATADDAGFTDDSNWEVRSFLSREEAELFYKSNPVSLAVVDIALHGDLDEDGIPVMYQLRKLHPGCRIIALTRHRDNGAGIRAMHSGADDFLNAKWQYFSWWTLTEKLRFFKEFLETPKDAGQPSELPSEVGSGELTPSGSPRE